MKNGWNINSLLTRFKVADRGAAAIEFALIAPIMVSVYLGVVELSNGLDVKRKVEGAASLAGSLVAQAEETSDLYMANIFEATNMAMEPFGTGPLKVVVTSVVRVFEDDEWKNKVDWSEGYNKASRAVGSELTPPGNILENNRGIIFTEVEYQYTSFINRYISGPITFTKTFWSHPRYVNSVPFSNS